VDDELRPYREGIWHKPVATDALAGLLAADWQFDLLAAEDRRRRQRVARRLAAALSPAAQLFGRDPPAG
jgi:hypothetical protein